MNFQDIVFFDFETTGVNPHTCQPIQLAAVMIDGRKMEIREDSIFSSYIKPIFDEEECRSLNLEPFSARITEITGITKETLDDAPHIATVWQEFIQYLNKFNAKKGKWGAPIKAGMNIERYDNYIIDRLCGGHMRHVQKATKWMLATGNIEEKVTVVEPYGFGNWDEDREEPTLFYPRDSLDLMRILWYWTENMQDIKSLSMDNIRKWLGIPTEGSHNAIKDVQDGAEVIIRLIKLHRKFAPKVKFANSWRKDDESTN